MLPQIDRRHFLKSTGALALAAGAWPGTMLFPSPTDAAAADDRMSWWRDVYSHLSPALRSGGCVDPVL